MVAREKRPISATRGVVHPIGDGRDLRLPRPESDNGRANPLATPKTNGKAERFIQTSLREWAYARADNSSDERTEELPRWTHGSIGSKPPISRLVLDRNNLLRLHS
jgi:hypothetical protein